MRAESVGRSLDRQTPLGMGVSLLGGSTDGIMSGAASGWMAGRISLGVQRRKSCVSPLMRSVDMVS
ncbi:MAG TPA: hypothetical protein QF469_16300, partial [Sphingomonas sanguinis]|uniref:hypothetical protein n=1 Tax=Sphingomonas sanguinis TaxID=33051 RepID=UPI002AC2E746|nr:hypothetical protein [Sphingomonas sanguinis]